MTRNGHADGSTKSIPSSPDSKDNSKCIKMHLEGEGDLPTPGLLNSRERE